MQQGSLPVGRRLVLLWRSLRAWRRIRFTLAGTLFCTGGLIVGFAAITTGNNLLYLLLGAMLGFITLSGWLSERNLRSWTIRRITPRATTAGRPIRISYEARNEKSKQPSFAVCVYEIGFSGHAFIPRAGPLESVTALSENESLPRGVYPLTAVTLSTTFPFGLFNKERDLALEGKLIVWPRADLPVTLPGTPGGLSRPRAETATVGAPGSRGEFRDLREYRVGDDPRDIHWKSTARTGTPVVRQYDQDAAEALWICLDLNTTPGDVAEGTVEIAASMATRAYHEGRPLGLAAGVDVIRPATGLGHLEGVLDALARVDFDPHGPPTNPPARSSSCVFVSAAQVGDEGSKAGFELPAEDRAS